jgi:outer membrane protein OmpA-like peptidoglycan-associated protein
MPNTIKENNMKKLLVIPLISSATALAAPPSLPPSTTDIISRASYYECVRTPGMDEYVPEVDNIYVCDDMLVVDGVVHFDFDKSNIDNEASTTLITFTKKLLMDSPSVKVTVVGHTDAVGTEAYNMGLGMRRAQAVAQYLRNKGVNVVEVISKGETELVENTQEKSRPNRRAVSTVRISLM